MDPWTHLGSELLEVMSWVGPLILLGCFDSLLRVCAKVSSYHRIPPSAYRLRTLCTPAHYVIPSMLLAIWGYPPSPWTHPSWGKTLRARGALGLGMDWSRLVLGYSTSPMRSGILVAWQPTSVWCIVCVSPLGTAQPGRARWYPSAPSMDLPISSTSTILDISSGSMD